ncbi:MAG: hypothetical protein R2867_38280 [Caldilineaceae bacterium]
MTNTTLFTPFLHDQGVVLLDGALATALEERGADLHDPLWSARSSSNSPNSSINFIMTT